MDYHIEVSLRLQVTPHPPIVRGLDLVVNKLRQAGHIVVEWQGPLRTGDLLDIGGEFTLSGARDDSE
jgi:amidase